MKNYRYYARFEWQHFFYNSPGRSLYKEGIFDTKEKATKWLKKQKNNVLEEERETGKDKAWRGARVKNFKNIIKIV